MAEITAGGMIALAIFVILLITGAVYLFSLPGWKSKGK